MYSYLVYADYMTDLSISRRALFRSLVSIIYLFALVFCASFMADTKGFVLKGRL